MDHMKTMYHITEEDVLAFVAGAVTDPQLRAAIEEARDTDPQVQFWFDLLDPDSDDTEGGTVIIDRDADPFVSEHDVIWLQPAEEELEPALDSSTDLPFRRIDTKTNTLTLKYSADSIPLGVARVVVKAKDPEGRELGSTLVVFRTFPRGNDSLVRVAEASCDAFELAASKPTRVHLHVIPATVANLSEFPIEQVRALRDSCNGDRELRATVEELIRLLETQ